MNSVILFPNDEGGVVFCYPCECGLTVEEIAQKDVPEGKPFLIVPADVLPEDHTFFNAFEADFSKPDGHGIGADRWFAERERERLIEEAAARHKAELAAQAAALIEQNTPVEEPAQ